MRLFVVIRDVTCDQFYDHIVSICAPVECSHVDTTGGMSEFT